MNKAKTYSRINTFFFTYYILPILFLFITYFCFLSSNAFDVFPVQFFFPCPFASVYLFSSFFLSLSGNTVARGRVATSWGRSSRMSGHTPKTTDILFHNKLNSHSLSFSLSIFIWYTVIPVTFGDLLIISLSLSLLPPRTSWWYTPHTST